jgi:DNA-binding response OmpR family regulator
MNAKRVLVVDDNEPVLGIVLRALGSDGYSALGALDGVSALEMIGTEPEPFDLLIVNQQLPRMPGDELVRRVRASRPSQPVLRILGNPVDAEEHPLDDCDTLVKPFPPARLLAEVHRLIGPATEAARAEA